MRNRTRNVYLSPSGNQLSSCDPQGVCRYPHYEELWSASSFMYPSRASHHTPKGLCASWKEQREKGWHGKECNGSRRNPVVLRRHANAALLGSCWGVRTKEAVSGQGRGCPNGLLEHLGVTQCTALLMLL